MSLRFAQAKIRTIKKILTNVFTPACVIINGGGGMVLEESFPEEIAEIAARAESGSR